MMTEDSPGIRPQDMILAVVIMLLALGVVMVYSAAGGCAVSLRSADRVLIMKSARVLVGLVGLLVLSQVDYHILAAWSLPFLGLNVIFLAAVYFFPPINGSHRWIPVAAGVRFQPSEMAKLALLLYLARYLSEQGDDIRKFRRGFMYPTFTIGVVCLLIFFERDLGTSALIGAVAYLVMLVAGARMMYVGGLACLAMPLVFAAVRHSRYQWLRLVTFLNPWAHADTTGYQCVQSLVALGSGGWTGVGLGAGRHKLFFVPEIRTDSVFCVIGEELGFVGAALVIVAFLLLLREGVRVALRAPDKLGALLAFGVSITIALQAVINIAVVTVSAPTKGIPLPLVSAGGSSLLFALCSIGVLLNIAKQASAPAPACDAPAVAVAPSSAP